MIVKRKLYSKPQKKAKKVSEDYEKLGYWNFII